MGSAAGAPGAPGMIGLAAAAPPFPPPPESPPPQWRAVRVKKIEVSVKEASLVEREVPITEGDRIMFAGTCGPD